MSNFKRLTSQHNNIAKHLIRLREKKQYRIDERCVVVQGIKTINELHAQGIKFRSLIVTSSEYPAIQKIPADNYYVTDINLTRRILGTASRPHVSEIYAEAEIPTWKLDMKTNNKLLVLDNINDPGNLGTLVRTARAMDWNSGIITTGTCDLFNDKALRASRALSLTWPHQVIDSVDILKRLKKNGYTPIVADMLPSSGAIDVWSPECGQQKPAVGNGLWFWNFNQKKEIPQKVALVLSSEHKGVNQTVFKEEIKVSLPMHSNVESLNVANAGGIIMYELNRYLNQKHTPSQSINSLSN